MYRHEKPQVHTFIPPDCTSRRLKRERFAGIWAVENFRAFEGLLCRRSVCATCAGYRFTVNNRKMPPDDSRDSRKNPRCSGVLSMCRLRGDLVSAHQSNLSTNLLIVQFSY